MVDSNILCNDSSQSRMRAILALRSPSTLRRMASYTGPWPARRVRDEFFNYFKSRGHTFVPSSPTVPYDDPTLLFANAGMNQVRGLFPAASQLIAISSLNPSSWAPSIPTLIGASSNVHSTAKSVSEQAGNTTACLIAPYHTTSNSL